jgi:hypothetical protein
MNGINWRERAPLLQPEPLLPRLAKDAPQVQAWRKAMGTEAQVAGPIA